MDERFRAFAWVLGGGSCGAALGTVFGTLAGVLYARSGRASGTRLGYYLAEAFGRGAGQKLTPASKGALIGAGDGFLFMGAVGTFMGAVAASCGRAPREILSTILFLALLLFGGATFFGLLAYSMTRVLCSRETPASAFNKRSPESCG